MYNLGVVTTNQGIKMAQMRIPRLKTCSACDRVGVASDGKCIRHTNSPRSDLYTLRDVSQIENPFGMELECYCEDEDILYLTDCVTEDGSLDEYGREMKILADVSEIGAKAADLARRAKLLGAFVDDSCGFHVHTSLPKNRSLNSHGRPQAINSSEASRLYSVMKPIEREVFSLFPARARNSYTSNLYNADNLYDHCSWVSISGSHPTIEVRVHSGTLSESKIFAWAEVCSGLQQLFHDAIQDVDSDRVRMAKEGKFIQLFKEGTAARAYLDARHEKGGRNVRFKLEAVEYD